MVCVAAVAVVVTAVWSAALRDTPASAQDALTNGYKLDPPEKVGAYESVFESSNYLGEPGYLDRIRSECAGAASADDCGQREKDEVGMLREDAEAVGVENVSGAMASYQPKEPIVGDASPTLGFAGLWGEISDPDEAVDRFFDSMENGEQDGFVGWKFTGSREEFQPNGFKGALMRCQVAEDETGSKRPVCVWADHSTVAGVSHIGTKAEEERGEYMSLSELADLAAQLYNTARTKT